MKEWLIRLTLMSLGLIIGVVALEFGLNRSDPHYEAFRDDILHQPNKYIGWKGIPNKEGKTRRGRIKSTVKMNSHGFRDREYTYEKKKDVFRVVILGDSMTEARQVELDKTYHAILEEKLNSGNNKKIEVINLGVSGFGTAQEYLTLKHYGLKYQPDFVILAFFIGNDISDNSLTLRKGRPHNIAMPFFVLNNGKLEKVHFKIPSKDEEQTKKGVNGRFQILKDFLAKFSPNIYYSLDDTTNKTPFQILKEFLAKLFPGIYYKLSDRAHKTPWLENSLRKLGILAPELLDKSGEIRTSSSSPYAREYPPEWENAWEVTKGLILKLAKELEMSKIGFSVVVIPEEREFRPDIQDKILENPQTKALLDIRKPERILSNFLEANNIDYLLLRPEFEKYTTGTGKRLHFPYKYENHWNANGHVFTAELIYKKLKEDKLVPIKVQN